MVVNRVTIQHTKNIKKGWCKIMKLIDLILNYKYLYNNTDDNVEMARYACGNSEVQIVTARIKNNVEKRKKELSELREISNQLFSALANNNIIVAGEELSLATALEQLGGFDSIYGKEEDVTVSSPNIFGPVGCPSVSSYSTVTGLKHPQMRFLESFSKGYIYRSRHEDDGDDVFVDPYKTLEDSDYTKLIAYEKELKSAFIQAISSIDV